MAKTLLLMFMYLTLVACAVYGVLYLHPALAIIEVLMLLISTVSLITLLGKNPGCEHRRFMSPVRTCKFCGEIKKAR
jgi:hypothetical protein